MLFIPLIAIGIKALCTHTAVKTTVHQAVVHGGVKHAAGKHSTISDELQKELVKEGGKEMLEDNHHAHDDDDD